MSYSPENHTLMGNLGIGTTDPTLGIALPAGVRIFGFTGTGVNTAANRGIIVIGNSRATASVSDPAGELVFCSQFNGTTPTSGTRFVADFVVSLTGAGGANGFGGQYEIYTKPDNTASLVRALLISDTGVITPRLGIRMTDDAANGGASLMNYYREADLSATFTSGGTGGGTSASVTLKITRVGRMVQLFIPSFSVTTGPTPGSSLGANTTLPTWARPTDNCETVNQNYVNATTSTEMIAIIVDSGGSVFFYLRRGGLSWDANTTTNMYGQTISYFV